MVFSSLIFIYAFLPLCLILYLAQSKVGARNAILVVFSLAFYAWGEPVYVFLMLATVAANHAFALGIDYVRNKSLGQGGEAADRGTAHLGAINISRTDEPSPCPLPDGPSTLSVANPRRIMRVLLIAALVLDLGLLGLFKYSGMLVLTINQLTGASIPAPDLAMPIGISFYTFQVITYLLDTYRGKVPVQRRFSLLLLYVSMFPQLVAGPIVRYEDIAESLSNRRLDYRLFCSGLSRFVAGLAKKAILANTAGRLAAELMSVDGFGSLSLLGAWLGIFTYALQIYFDFSAYSDMAIGMGRMLGFRFKENFEYPYIARSATEFWRRWHISLGSFFREYVYIPLGGNRKLLYRNLLITWALTGLWHGASWNYVLWGLFWFVFIALEKRVLAGVFAKLPRAASHVYLLLLMLLGWVIFYYTDLGAAGQFYLALFGAAPGGLSDPYALLVLENNVFFLVLAAVGCTPVIVPARKLAARLSHRGRKAAIGMFAVRHAWLAVLLLFSTAMLVGNSYNPFIYFRF